MIPKVIHYCWFGKAEKPKVILDCIDSWKKYCPDWKIIEWNEDNFDITLIPFMEEAYNNKKWAFVSDVARLLIIYHEGGFYLDTDVKLHKSINGWLKYESVFFFESKRYIASGLGFGAERNNLSVKAMLDYYSDKHFVTNGKMDVSPCPAHNTESFKSVHSTFIQNGKNQQFGNEIVLSLENYNIFANHLGTATWVENPPKMRSYKDTIFKRILRSNFVFSIIDKIPGKRIQQVYTFFAYDIQEYGISYFINKLIKKLVR